MLPDRVSNPGPLTYASDALQIALRGPALIHLQSDPLEKGGKYSYLAKLLPLKIHLFF